MDRPECVLDVVGNEQGQACWAAVRERGPDHPRQVGTAGDVVHGVVHEHGVEGAAEPNRPHVPVHVLAFGVESP